MSEWKDNPARYRELNQPFESAEALNTAVNTFYDGLEKLRVEHKIADLYVVVSVPYLVDGEEARAMTSAGWGDGLRFESMAAYALGALQSDRKSRINKMLARGGK